MNAGWKVSPLTRRHVRAEFDCGEVALNQYLRQYARQNQEQDIGRTWVALEGDSLVVRGYYTLSASAVAFANLPDGERKRLPQYPVPVAHLGRLAVDLATRGRGLGEYLLMHALHQVAFVSETVAIRGVEVRSKTDAARRFYMRYGFVPLLDDPHHLYLSMHVVRSTFAPPR